MFPFYFLKQLASAGIELLNCKSYHCKYMINPSKKTTRGGEGHWKRKVGNEDVLTPYADMQSINPFSN